MERRREHIGLTEQAACAACEVLGYGDRSAIMEPAQLSLVVPGNNGMFRATIIDDGGVVGVWKCKVTSTRVDISPEFFSPPSARQRSGVDRAAQSYGAFLGLEPRVLTEAATSKTWTWFGRSKSGRRCADSLGTRRRTLPRRHDVRNER